MIDFAIQEHLKVVSETFNKRAIEKNYKSWKNYRQFF